jgi:SET domain-containing protein
VPPAEFVHAAAVAGPSMIAGVGLFAENGIPVREVVLRLASVVRRPDELTGVNHSCDPNLGFADDRTLVAKRDIAEREELTLDYATVISDARWVLWCHCETYRCRQVVEGTDWQIPQLQQRYGGWWAPAVQALIDTGVRQPG